jgi:hypothetical protein
METRDFFGKVFVEVWWVLMVVVGGDSGGWEAPIEAVGKRL